MARAIPANREDIIPETTCFYREDKKENDPVSKLNLTIFRLVTIGRQEMGWKDQAGFSDKGRTMQRENVAGSAFIGPYLLTEFQLFSD